MDELIDRGYYFMASDETKAKMDNLIRRTYENFYRESLKILMADKRVKETIFADVEWIDKSK